MKKSDIAMIVLISSLSVMIAFFVASSIPGLGKPQKGEKVKTIEPITSKVDSPDEAVFNSNSINPTVETVIGSDAQ